MVWFVITVFALAGMIKGTIGLGLPAVSMGLLTMVISPFQAATLLIIPSMVTNIWQLFAEGRVLQLIRRFWLLLIGIIVGSIWSVFPTLGHSDFNSEALLGGMLALYGLYGLFAKSMPNLSKYENWLSPIMGYLGGALTVATGVVVIPVVPYLQTLNLQRDDLVQSLGLAFTTSTICLAIFLHQNPVENMPIDYVMSMIALIPALIGMWLGTKIRYRISEQKFRKVFFFGLIALGSYMILR
ncbi:sulfite exporter TauE/SafE family protein [Acinetobacter portensis]|uniref:Probable membrane transporter protein n=2 Tax=Acinetobacter TaxID=469 RepID=A0A6L6GG92_9GAMM|nr:MULTISPECIES: sulfite exporter TauE/SafE family protein [Acinetobacter]MCK7610227.1 sulfite exporter TauE/SafE family protein [Acinetobacter portensis]MCK7641005.1 sulfite exporter TauE/SafE family protein [Acinetobacter portensis]MDY6460227.1 sulfite exporter TauE/SafE family protein [Acinetobacter faecalis]MDY6484071.1 sulfite exporter TauE/SafE family protein [Acinetobacter faecalis]MDY6487658.1 sulfite exporter TauE/SafE family protein [Acinetobacter faecalis]